ncbi:hypothetical protein J7355_13390 [Endozoicomonas sp. G2_2]|nr:hypothetical protein [Endozoicomonas sp. G2_2]
MVAISVALLLGYLAVQMLGGHQDQARSNAARDFFIEELPRALTTYESEHGSHAAVDKPSLLVYGLQKSTAWDEIWTIESGSARGGVDVTYPISGRTPDTIGTNLASFLNSVTASGSERYPFVIGDASYESGSSAVSAKVRAY